MNIQLRIYNHNNKSIVDSYNIGKSERVTNTNHRIKDFVIQISVIPCGHERQRT